MVRPKVKELTERELEIMHLFWRRGELSAAAARDRLAESGVDRAYVTVANLVRLLVETGFLEQTNQARPFQYRPVRSFEDVSSSLVQDLVERVFHGSREQLLMRADVDDAAGLHHQDAIGQAERRHAVGDDERRAVANEGLQDVVDDLFAFQVDLTGRFVKDEDARITQDGPR